MNIYYSHFTLEPLKRLTRGSNMELKEGIFLKGTMGNSVTFAEYFPHLLFGDKGCDQFLVDFKFQKNEYDRKVLYLLQKDKEYQSIQPIKIHNHQLWRGSEDLISPIIKYKLLKEDDFIFMDPLKRGIRVRLDCGSLFSRESFKQFLSTIPENLLHLIDYVEDPIIEKDWTGLGMKTAKDIFNGTNYDYYVHRPTCAFFPDNEKSVIFSSYLGSDLGRWHSYCELIELGDLRQTHGVISDGLYTNQLKLLKGSFYEGFTADIKQVNDLYLNLHQQDWKFLCSI